MNRYKVFIPFKDVVEHTPKNQDCSFNDFCVALLSIALKHNEQRDPRSRFVHEKDLISCGWFATGPIGSAVIKRYVRIGCLNSKRDSEVIEYNYPDSWLP
jgi:hypothetical protein